MAASMRDSPLDGGHRGKVADPNNKSTHSSATTAAGAVVSASNFEYDDNEWDIGIGNLIIDLDADIEKTNEKGSGGGAGAVGTVGVGGVPAPQQQAANNNTINNNNNNNFNNNSMASTGTGASGGAKGKMSAAAAVEHSATVDKGLKMKIKRTKPGTKEAKHEIVKAPVDGVTAGANNSVPAAATQNGDSGECTKVVGTVGSKHPGGSGGSKRGSSGHRRDKARDKHADKQQPALAKTADVNGVLPATPAVVSGGGGVTTGPPTAAVVAPASAQQQLPSTPAVAVAPGPTPPPLPVSSQQPPQVTPPSPASMQVQSVPLQPTVVVPSSAVPQQNPPTPVAPQSVLQQPPAAAADLPPQTTALLVFSGTAGSTAAPPGGVCVSVAGGKTSLQQTPQDPPCGGNKSSGVKQCGPEDTGGPTPPLTGNCASPPPTKKLKTGPLVNCVGSSCGTTVNGPSDAKTDVSDVCVGTSVGTITEPDCLGPCEPGTSVTLEGIVWHETEGGVLVVNVTWRGKTYVGTLLDCTKHDWAPPRFCDSPTSDLDARTPKGRGKRGRAAAVTPVNDLSNFTETRSSVHSKLRNGAKGRRGAAGSPAPPTVPSFAAPKPDGNNKRKGRPSETEESSVTPTTGIGNGGGGKRSRSGSRGPTVSPPVSPVLLECPEPNCSKKYKHINGLKYHQSHAHGAGEEDSLLDSKDAISLSENDESNAEPPSVPPSPSPEKCSPLPKPEPRKEEIPSVVEQQQLPSVPPQASTPPNQSPSALPSSVPPPEVVSADKTLVKPGVLRFGPTEDSASMPPTSHFPVGVYCNSSSKPSVSPSSNLPGIRAVALTTTAPVINIPQPPSVKLLPSSQPVVQPSQQQPQSLSQIPQSPQPSPVPTATTPPSTVQPQDAATNKLCDKYKVKIPSAPQRPPATVPGLSSSPLKSVQSSSKPVSLMPDMGDKKDKSKVGVVLQGSPQQQQLLPQQQQQQQPQQLTNPVQQQQQMMNKKKNRKSPASSPQPEGLHNGAMIYGLEASPLATPAPNEGREDVQSPAYSDISDDAAPVLESEVGDKCQPKMDKKVETQPPHNIGHYGMYPFYGQPPYLVPSVPTSNVVPEKVKEVEKVDGNKPLDRSIEKDKKDLMPGSGSSPADFQQKLLQQQQQAPPPPQPQQPHYYPYSFVPGYAYNLDSYPMSVMTEKYMQEPHDILERPKSLTDKEIKIKEIKEEKLSSSSMDIQSSKSGSLPMKDRPMKSEPSSLKEKQNENHQILKESIEMKSQMNDKSKFSSYDTNQYLYRQQQEDLRRYYLYPEQQAQAAQAAQAAAAAVRRKDPPAQPLDATVSKDKGSSKSMSTMSSPKISSHKDKLEDKQLDKKQEQDKPSKQEGVKPTMETQGPPPPTSSYAYIHPSYMQSPHYGALPFDPNHPMYRGINPMLVPGPYGANPYLHPQMRYHGPEDLSRGPPSAPPKALDMLQHHASQYYSSHKIHELQERALKSPTPKSTSTPQPAPINTGSGPPSSGALGGSSSGSTGPSGPPTAPGPTTSKPPSADGKDAPAPLRSPPPQRHVHTHHHTHVGLGYPLLPGQYPAPYGAVLATQQAAAVAASVISPYPPPPPSAPSK